MVPPVSRCSAATAVYMCATADDDNVIVTSLHKLCCVQVDMVTAIMISICTVAAPFGVLQSMSRTIFMQTSYVRLRHPNLAVIGVQTAHMSVVADVVCCLRIAMYMYMYVARFVMFHCCYVIVLIDMRCVPQRA